MMVLGCEEWKSVVGYEGLYEVSNLGRVLSLPRDAASWITDEEKHRRGKLLSVSRNVVCLCKNNQRQVCALKDIVLQAFVDPSVRHFDVDYLDNHVRFENKSDVMDIHSKMQIIIVKLYYNVNKKAWG